MFIVSDGIDSFFRDLFTGDPNSDDHDPLFIADYCAISIFITFVITNVTIVMTICKN